MKTRSSTSSTQVRERFLLELRDFICNELPKRHTKLSFVAPPTETEPLFETGLLDSLAIVHLVTYLEERLGRPLTLQEVTMGTFKNMETIADRFAGEVS